MPASIMTENTGATSLDLIVDHLDYITMDDDIDKEEAEQAFLNNLFRGQNLQHIVKLYDNLQEAPLLNDGQDEGLHGGRSILGDAGIALRPGLRRYPEARELKAILDNVHMKNLLSSYEDISFRKYGPQLGDVNFALTDWPDEYEPADFEVPQTPTGRLSQHPRESITSITPGGSGNQKPSQISNLNQGMFIDDYQPRPIGEMSYRSVISMADLPQLVGIRKELNEPLGLTVVRHDSIEKGIIKSRVVVERILAGSVIDRQGLLNVGDVILEINDETVETPDMMQRTLKQIPSGTINVKILRGPSNKHITSDSDGNSFMRAFFSYNPKSDTLLPSRTIGLSFEAGEVLEVVSKDDPNFWQARRYKSNSRKTGLIPSPMLEERRKAYTSTSQNTKPKKASKAKIFSATDATKLFNRSEIWTYEEVIQVPPAVVTCLLLVGADHVGRRSLKLALCAKEPYKFACPIIDTTQPTPRNQPPNDLLRVISKAKMEADIKSGEYCEWWEVVGHLFGVRISSVREIIDRGRTAVLDCKPKGVRILRRPEVNPHVVFIASPSLEVVMAMQEKGVQLGIVHKTKSEQELRNVVEDSEKHERLYRHFFDSVLINDNFDVAVTRLSGIVARLERSPGWIPASWEADMVPLLPPIPKDQSGNQGTLEKPTKYRKRTDNLPAQSSPQTRHSRGTDERQHPHLVSPTVSSASTALGRENVEYAEIVTPQRRQNPTSPLPDERPASNYSQINFEANANSGPRRNPNAPLPRTNPNSPPNTMNTRSSRPITAPPRVNPNRPPQATPHLPLKPVSHRSQSQERLAANQERPEKRLSNRSQSQTHLVAGPSSPESPEPTPRRRSHRSKPQEEPLSSQNSPERSQKQHSSRSQFNNPIPPTSPPRPQKKLSNRSKSEDKFSPDSQAGPDRKRLSNRAQSQDSSPPINARRPPPVEPKSKPTRPQNLGPVVIQKHESSRHSNPTSPTSPSQPLHIDASPTSPSRSCHRNSDVSPQEQPTHKNSSSSQSRPLFPPSTNPNRPPESAVSPRTNPNQPPSINPHVPTRTLSSNRLPPQPTQPPAPRTNPNRPPQPTQPPVPRTNSNRPPVQPSLANFNTLRTLSPSSDDVLAPVFVDSKLRPYSLDVDSETGETPAVPYQPPRYHGNQPPESMSPPSTQSDSVARSQTRPPPPLPNRPPPLKPKPKMVGGVAVQPPVLANQRRQPPPLPREESGTSDSSESSEDSEHISAPALI